MHRSSGNRIGRVVRLILFNAAATLGILVALEMVSRWVWPVGLPDPFVGQQDEAWSRTRRYDSLLFWSLRPSAHGSNWTTNRLGLRGPEVPVKTAGEFRILSCGESTTFAGRLPYEQSYSNLLEHGLASVQGRAVRVINAGVPGYTLFQGVIYLRERGLALEPDAVLIYFGYNDFLPVAYREQRDAGGETAVSTEDLTDREIFELRSRPSRRAIEALLSVSNLARAISFRSHSDPSHVTTGRKRRVPDSDRRALLKELRELCRERGVRLAVIIPWYRSFEEHAPLLRELRAWNDVLLIDLPAMLADLPKARSAYFRDDVHPNAEGHRLIAGAIERELRAAWL
jgi:lysophospholipase L1-like esterase